MSNSAETAPSHASAPDACGNAKPRRSVFARIRRVVGWTLLVLVPPYTLAIAYLWIQRPVISFDPVAEFINGIPAAHPQESAWPLYKQGLIAVADARSQVDPSKPVEPLAFMGYGEKTQGSAMPWDDEWTKQRDLLAKNRAGLDLLTQGSRRQFMGYFPEIFPKEDDRDVFPFDPNLDRSVKPDFPLFSMLLPHLSLMRSASRLLASDALHSIEARDGARFVTDIETIVAIAKHVEEGNFLISQLVGSAIRAQAFERITMALEWHPESLSDDDLARLAAILRAIPPQAYEVNLDSEFLGIRDMVQRTYSDDERGDGWFNPVYGGSLVREVTTMTAINDSSGPPFSSGVMGVMETLLSPIGAALVAKRRETIELCQEIFDKSEAQSKLPIWEQDFAYETQFEALVHQDTLAQLKWTLPRLLLPAVAKTAQGRRLGESQCLCAQTGIALIQYQRAHGGAWPTSLDALVPEYLPAVPRDPQNGQAVSYQVDNDRARVWSVAGDKLRSWRHDSPHSAWIWFSSGDGLARFNK